MKGHLERRSVFCVRYVTLLSQDTRWMLEFAFICLAGTSTDLLRRPKYCSPQPRHNNLACRYSTSAMWYHYKSFVILVLNCRYSLVRFHSPNHYQKSYTRTFLMNVVSSESRLQRRRFYKELAMERWHCLPLRRCCTKVWRLISHCSEPRNWCMKSCLFILSHIFRCITAKVRYGRRGYLRMSCLNDPVWSWL